MKFIHCNKHTYLEVKIIKKGNKEDINGRINKRKSAISKLNSILRDKDITIKTKTNII